MSAVAGIVLSGTFLMAAAGKAVRLPRFREQIADYELIPYTATAFAATVVLASEAVIGVLLIVAETRRFGALLAVSVLVVFTAAQAQAARAGRRISCACFGGSELDSIGAHSFLRNLTYIGLGVLALVPQPNPINRDSLVVSLLVLVILMVGVELTGPPLSVHSL